MSYKLLLMLFLFSCEKERVEPYAEYVIKKGEHRSINEIKLHSGNTLEFAVIFDSSAIYQTEDQAMVNKLMGLSDCNSQHHDNSIRIGWRWFNDRLELLSYCYSNENRNYKVITAVEIGKEYHCKIEIKESEYIISVNGEIAKEKRGCNSESLKYYLYPYFGGQEAAPHDIKIKIRQ